MTRTHVVTSLMVVAALALAGCPTSEPHGPPCDDDSWCDVGWFCEAGYGCTWECREDGDCAGVDAVCEVARGRCIGAADAGPRDAGRPDGATRDAPAARCDVTPDADGDGDRAIECGGHDCDDSDPDRSSLNEEESDDFNRDEDCNPCTVGEPRLADADGDGFFSTDACNTVDTRPADDECPGFSASRPTIEILSDTLVCGTDCDDRAAGTYPTATDSCDGHDNDCDGETDEDELETYYRDVDGDGAGDPAMPLQSCTQPLNYVSNRDDCNDSNGRMRGPAIAGGEGTDSAADCDNLDNDCDFATDEGDPGGGAACNPPGRPGAPCAGVYHCRSGGVTCVQNDPLYPRGETCNNIDDDCSGGVDGFDDDCTNPCGAGYGMGRATCTAGAWGPCSSRSASRGCPGVQCGSGTETCSEGAWSGSCSSVTGGEGSCALCSANWPGTLTCRVDGTWSSCAPRNYTLDGTPGCPSSYMFYHGAGYSTGCAWYVPDNYDGTATVLGIDPWMPYGVYRITVTGTALDSGAFGVWVDWNGTSTAFTDRRLGGTWTLQGEFALGGTCGEAGWSQWPTIVYRGGYWAGWMRISGVTIERLRDG